MNLQHRKASTGAPEPPRLVLTVPVPTSARRVNNRLSSSGTVTGAGAAGCESTAAGCALSSFGTIAGAFGGTYSTSFTIFWLQKTPNGAGGFCAPASGATTLTIPGLGTLTKSEQGTVCEVGPSGPNVRHTMTNG